MVDAELEDAADIDVGHFAGQAHLIGQTLDRPLVVQRRCQQRLQRHALTDHGVEGFVHLAHPAAGNEPPDLVTTKQVLAVRQRAEGGAAGWCSVVRRSRCFRQHQPAAVAVVDVRLQAGGLLGPGRRS